MPWSQSVSPAAAAVVRALDALRRPSPYDFDGGFDGNRLDARDAALIAEVLPAVTLLNRHYLRLRADGLEHLHATQGPAIYVANHNSGIMGPDLACTLGTLWSELGVESTLYALAHDFAMRQLKPLGRLVQRFGAVRASQENARRILEQGGRLLVYPGGDLDAYRHSRQRDTIILGERTGFIRLAQQMNVPIIPIVAHGAHRSAYIFSEGEWLARLFNLKRWGRLERFPLALSLPWGLSIGPWVPYLPLPFPISLRVLPKVHVLAQTDPKAAREAVRAQMQRALDALAESARQKWQR